MSVGVAIGALPMIVDEFEPTEEIVPLLTQSIPAQVGELNRLGFADYFWQAIDSHTIQMERKQNGELLGSLDAVEEQLVREYNSADETLLVIEGFIIPTAKGCGALKQVKGDKKFYYVSREYNVRYGMLMSWLYQLDKNGITHYMTADLRGTAALLSSLYKNSQKQEHTTMRRYIKPRIHIEDFNPHVLSLMGIPEAGLGETRARAMVKELGTLHNIINAEEGRLCRIEGLGPASVRRFLKAVGR